MWQVFYFTTGILIHTHTDTHKLKCWLSRAKFYQGRAKFLANISAQAPGSASEKVLQIGAASCHGWTDGKLDFAKVMRRVDEWKKQQANDGRYYKGDTLP